MSKASAPSILWEPLTHAVLDFGAPDAAGLRPKPVVGNKGRSCRRRLRMQQHGAGHVTTAEVFFPRPIRSNFTPDCLRADMFNSRG
jgi:hypothetical protein